MKAKNLLSVFAASCGVALAVVSAPAFAEPGKAAQPAAKMDDKKMEKKSAGAVIGEAAPSFTLTCTEGKSHNLSDFKGKTVVIEWFNPECPFIVKHHKTNMTFNQLHEQYNSKDVVFLAINSSAQGKQGNGLELNKKMKEEYKMPFPILLDESGDVGRAYGAKTTPHVFIVDKDGKLVYKGAVDNNTSAEKAGDKNYVKMALDQILAGKPVSEAETKPYGCSVKYAK